MKPIETIYNGYRFRSRLEARWAVYFDALDVKYEYEKEGYDLAETWYLPDFWLPTIRTWVEIKGERPTQEEIRKCILLAQATDSEVLMGWRTPGEWDEGQMLSIYPDTPDYDWVNLTGHWWYACKNCGYVGTSFEAKTSRCKCADWSGTHNQGRNGWTYDTARMKAAYDAAHSARFEFGEKGI